MTQEIEITQEQIGLLSGLIPDKKNCTENIPKSMRNDFSYSL